VRRPCVTVHLHRWLHAGALASLVALTAGCGSSAKLSSAGGSGARSARSQVLYVIPRDSLLALVEGMPVEVALSSGGRVAGTSLRPHPSAPTEFRLRATAREVFAHRDTVQIPLGGIEVAVSSVALTEGSELYHGSRELGPLPLPGENLDKPALHAIMVLTAVAVVGAVVLAGALAQGLP